VAAAMTSTWYRGRQGSGSDGEYKRYVELPVM
jgi:hypothetical protein